MWIGEIDGYLRILDQTQLPGEVIYLDCTDGETVRSAIQRLEVRGAPAIGVAGGYGLCLAVRNEMNVANRADAPIPKAPQAQNSEIATASELERLIETAAVRMSSARPTAVNLEWAVRRVAERGFDAVRQTDSAAGTLRNLALATLQAMLDEAHAIALEDERTCRQIGEVGANLVPEGGGVLTHCNAGALATAGWGTALAVLYVAHERGRRLRVFADETRPLRQGLRLTAYELACAGIEVTVLCDGAAAQLLASGQVQMVIVGADRIARNGDVANKIGTYGVALAAKAHGVPFYVAAPRSTFDMELSSGREIPIEHRDEGEVLEAARDGLSSFGVRAYNPAFDVTPASLITGIVTEVGLISPVTEEGVKRNFFVGKGLQ